MNVLFVCRQNSGRSQMAEVFFNKLSKKHKSSSAGVEVHENHGKPIHELVIIVMKELGFDLSKNTKKHLTKEVIENVDKIVSFMEKDKLPDFLKNSKKIVFWEVEDPKGKPLEGLRIARDEIKKLVEKLVSEID